MPRISCFGATDPDDFNDIQSHHSADAPATSRIDKAARLAQSLFPHKRDFTREDAKQRLKKILNMKKDHNDKERPVEDDPEFHILGKIYSELDAAVDLASIARNRATLSHLLPFLINALLYGYMHIPGSGLGSSRSTKKSSNLRVTRDPKQITLGGTSHLVKAACERQLEQFLYQQAMNSVSFALECVWYLTGSLYLGPKETYHRTMTLLLGMESVVANSAPPGDLFKKAAVTETVPRPPLDNSADAAASSHTAPVAPDIPRFNASPTVERTSSSPYVSAASSPYISAAAVEHSAASSTATGIADASFPAPLPETSGVAVGSAVTASASTDRIEPRDRLRPTVREVDLDITGSGENDHRMKFSAPLKGADEEKLQKWLDARRERATVFHAQLDFVKCLTHISHGLFDVEHEFRRDVLRRELEKLNDFIPKNVFIPTERRPHRVLRIVPEDVHVFSTKERVPYLLVVEVEDLSPPCSESEWGGAAGGAGAGAGGAAAGSVHDSRMAGPLRRIGSISSASGVGRHHGNGHCSAAASSSVKSNVDDAEDSAQLKHQPDSKFEFSPDVTAESSTVNGMKRESSFRVDTQFADDRRPPDEELLKALGEPWAVKSERLRKASPFGNNPNWRLVSCIVKARDQLRQEMFAQRLIQEFARIFERAGISVWLRAYQILSTSSDSGLIETVTDAKSIDSIKKHSPNVYSLQDYFVGRFGGRGSQEYKRAVRNFVQSMAGYSIVQYLLNIKDRHNGNLMIGADGHVVHIDFGFLLSNSPGGNMEFEKAPFKLTNEMVEVMGGSKSSAFKLFKKLCVQGYLEACRYANKILLMVDIMYPGNESMPCFLQGREYVLENLRERFGVDLSRKERANRMVKLIASAHGNWTTKAYDRFQKVSLGIAK